MNWTAADVDKAQKPTARPKAATKTPQATPVPAALNGAGRSELTKPAAEVTHYIGPYQLNVANGTHYPGRARIVVVGPASDELTAALVAAITQIVSTKP